MKMLCTIFVGLLLVTSCGSRYHTLTLTNEAQAPMSATLLADGQQMTVSNGETTRQEFEENIYIFQANVTFFEPETTTMTALYTIDLDRNMTCIISDTGEPVTWE